MAAAPIRNDGKFDLLRRNVFFQNLDDDTLAKIADKFVPKSYKRHDYIWFQGSPSNFIAVIKEGYVKIIKHSDNGKDTLVELLGAGDIIGAVALLEGRPYPATACALCDLKVLILSREQFLEMIASTPAIAVQALIAIGARLRYAHEMMRQLAVEIVECRIANLFLMLASRTESSDSNTVVLKLRLTRKDVAEMVGTTLETATRILSRWEKNKLLIRDSSSIIIPDLSILERIAVEESQ